MNTGATRPGLLASPSGNLLAQAISALRDGVDAVPPRGNVLSFIKYAPRCRDAALTMVALGLKTEEIISLVDRQHFSRIDLYGLLVATTAREVRHIHNAANRLE